MVPGTLAFAVCAALSRLVHVTVSPTATVSSGGEKANSVISMVVPPPAVPSPDPVARP
jgi:hypothetical protein